MARCPGCKKEVKAAQMRTAVMEKDERGKLKAVWHNKCKRPVDRKAAIKESTGHDKYRPDRPSAYDMGSGSAVVRRSDMSPEELARREKTEEEYTKLQARLAEIAEQRELEETPGGFTDWREPETLDIETLVAETEKAREAVEAAEEAAEKDTNTQQTVDESHPPTAEGEP